ncbi:MAG TPA: chorismate pyruvate-lyase family protein [Polyangiaceae bacterium]|nr:chorismate pyruvate-lyase family protein [Polyangiaceae bacterium]
MLEAYYKKQGTAGQYEVFRSRGFSADGVVGALSHKELALAALPPFLRTLLVADGTVTKSLEAYYWEPISVDTVWQKPMAAEADIPWLNVAQGQEVIGRRVNLRGTQSGNIYTHAFSVVRPERIPEQLRQKLIAGSLGIGELIRDCGLETYRELLEIDVARAEQGEQIYRTYRIVMGGEPSILVTEHFPVDVFRNKR